MPFMIAHGASVVVVRDGKRKTIQAGGGADFTDEEITSVNRAAPGSLRKPINEGRSAAEAEASDDAPKGKKAVPKNETAKQKKAREAAEAVEAAKAEEAAKKAAADKGDDDDDEDGDI